MPPSLGSTGATRWGRTPAYRAVLAAMLPSFRSAGLESQYQSERRGALATKDMRSAVAFTLLWAVNCYRLATPAWAEQAEHATSSFLPKGQTSLAGFALCIPCSFHAGMSQGSSRRGNCLSK